MSALLTGVVLGFLVAAQPGPVSFLVVRTAARGPAGRLPAFMIGLAAASVDMLYAALGAAGVAPILHWRAARLALGMFGSAFLGFIGVRIVWTAWQLTTESRPTKEPGSWRRAFWTGFTATASNPLTIASWAAIFAAASVSGVVNSVGAATALVGGIGVAGFCWFTTLTLVVNAAFRRMGTSWVRGIDMGCGLVLLGFGILLMHAVLTKI